MLQSGQASIVVLAIAHNVQKLPARRSCAVLTEATEGSESGNFFVIRCRLPRDRIGTGIASPVGSDRVNHETNCLHRERRILPKHGMACIGRNDEVRVWPLSSPFRKLTDPPSKHPLVVEFIHIGGRAIRNPRGKGRQDHASRHVQVIRKPSVCHWRSEESCRCPVFCLPTWG